MTATLGQRGDSGLTLVELLVVLALLGLLGSLLAGGLHTAAQAWRQVAVRDAEGEELDAARTLLRGLLSQSAPALAGDAAHRVVRFSGGPDQVAFLAPLARRFGAEDIVAYTLRFDPGGALQLAWHLDRNDAAATDGVAPVGAAASVLTALADGSFLYYGSAGEGEAPHWWSSWAGQRALPQLVRVRFTWRGRTEDLIVAPRLTAASCAPDAAEVTCSD